jgi:hypothetical protein
MARTKTPASPKSTAIAPRAGSQDLATLDASLSQEIANIRDTIGAPGGKAIKVEVMGTFTLPDSTDLGDSFQAVIVDYTSKNFLYEGKFDKNNPSPPICFAQGKVIAQMAPVPESPQPQSKDCASCAMNQWSSGEGNAKACKNTRELALLLVDENGAHNAADAPIYTFSVSPTKIKSFDAFVTNCARLLGGPPIKAIITLKAKNAGTYADVTFIDMVPNPDYAVHVARRPEAKDMLERVPDFTPRQAPARNSKPAPKRAGATRR